jgi:pantetheine-phosphate adenylyltransferase
LLSKRAGTGTPASQSIKGRAIIDNCSLSRKLRSHHDKPEKRLLFSTEERVELVKKAVAHLKNVKVQPYSGLTVSFAKKIGARVLVRGLRMSSDFEREFEMEMMNKKLEPGLELFCLMASLQYQFLSSSLLKEVAQLKGCLDNMVPPHVAVALRKKFGITKK